MSERKAVVELPKPEEESIADLMKKVLARLGEDPTREGLVQTPARADKAYRFLTSGYNMDVKTIVNGALFSVTYDEMVIVKNIEFFSLCEHHLLPFFGKVHVAYLPKDKVIGLSKIPRIVDSFARPFRFRNVSPAKSPRRYRTSSTPREWGSFAKHGIFA